MRLPPFFCIDKHINSNNAMKHVEKLFFFSKEFEKLYDYYDSLTIEELSQLSQCASTPETETRDDVATIVEEEED